VLLVIFLHHALGVRTGWVGVDIFFVLSGFLITGILLRSNHDPRYWRTFYIRRATRILPPLAVLFTLTLLLAHHLSVRGLLGYALFAGDFMNVTRFGIAPLVILWSLAIEEHFYFVWPFFTRYLRIPTLTWVLVIMILAEPIARLAGTAAHLSPMSTYYLTPFRLDGLACGALLALIDLTGRGKDLLRRWGGWAALVGWTVLTALELTIPSFTFPSGSLLFNGLAYSLAALASLATIGWVAWNPESLVSRMLALPPVAWIGRISYGMYLYHVMVLIMTRHLFHAPPPPDGAHSTRLLVLIDLPLTVLFSWISFRFLEAPILRWGHKITRGNQPGIVSLNYATRT
jgi:peptidoglycan/LPS O-acetylase OafA/YrhL